MAVHQADFQIASLFSMFRKQGGLRLFFGLLGLITLSPLAASPSAAVGAQATAVITTSTNQPAATSKLENAAGQVDLALPESNDSMPGTGPVRRYDWFVSLWNSRRAEFQKLAESQKHSVVLLGDSITQGWGDQTDQLFAGVKIANRGISGDTTRGMLYRLDQDVIALEPACVVMLMGTNDLEENATPDVIAGNVALILDRIAEKLPTTPVVLCEIFPSSASKKRPADKIRETNRLLAAYAKGKPQITFLETWALFADSTGDAPVAEFPDLLHLNEAGYARWASALRPIFATFGFLETEADSFQPEEGFELLFNGKDLTGWGFRSSPDAEPKETFDGQPHSSDGRYKAINGRLVVTTPPEGRRVQQLWTTRNFTRDFEFKLEFRATPNADSGVFLRGKQLQCRDYRLAGPYKELTMYKPQDWNELHIVVRNGVAHCTCNGEVLEAEYMIPAIGPMGLEGDSGQMEYRRIRLRELP